MKESYFSEDDLKSLIGQYESIRLDFKASALLSQPVDRIVKQLTEDVSAFANTEGGIIVIGIKEGKSGKKSIGTEIDEGVDVSVMGPERLEQLIATNISPQVPGLVVRPIQLSGVKAGRVAYVIVVPKGTTAYQARQQHKYFGRTEFAAVPLEDYVIRLLMNRGRVPHAVIEIGPINKFDARQDFEGRSKSLASLREQKEIIRSERLEKLEAPQSAYDSYYFKLLIRNDGPITIRDCALALEFQASDRNQLGTGALSEKGRFFEFGAQNRTLKKISGSSSWGTEEERAVEVKLHPEQALVFPEVQVSVAVPPGTEIDSGSLGMLIWRIYLEDAPTVSGEIDLGLAVKTHGARRDDSH